MAAPSIEYFSIISSAIFPVRFENIALFAPSYSIVFPSDGVTVTRQSEDSRVPALAVTIVSELPPVFI